MSKVIRIGDVSIPLDDYATSGSAVLGIKESGKTVLTKGIAEQLLDFGIPPVIFDAIGVWRHLKTAGEGTRGKGFKVVVAGGKEPDVPLTTGSAAEIVRAAIRENIPLVIDLYNKHLSKADWRRIVQTCFRTLLYENVGVRHIFLEETPEYAPQKVIDGETYAEVEKLVRMGGNASLGITLISQRAQEVNKSVLDLCENVILMRQRGAHAIDNLEKFMDRLAPEQSRGIAKKMPNMKAGECYVFTGTNELAQYTRSEMCRSFHPDRRKPVAIDTTKRTVVTSDFVTRLSADLAHVIEETKANDPKVLRARIAELERGLKTSKDANAGAGHDEDRAYERGLVAGRAESQRHYNDFRACAELLRKVGSAMKGTLDPIFDQAQQCEERAQQILEGSKPAAVDSHARSMRSPTTPREASASGNGTGNVGGGRPKGNRLIRLNDIALDLPRGERTVLTAIAQFDGKPVEVDQFFTLTGYKSRSITEYVSRLRTKGFVSDGWPITATSAGVQALGPTFAPLPTGRALFEFWRNRLSAGENKVLEVVASQFPGGISNEDIGTRTDYASRSVTEYVSRLKARRLVARRGQFVVASEALFS